MPVTLSRDTVAERTSISSLSQEERERTLQGLNASSMNTIQDQRTRNVLLAPRSTLERQADKSSTSGSSHGHPPDRKVQGPRGDALCPAPEQKGLQSQASSSEAVEPPQPHTIAGHLNAARPNLHLSMRTCFAILHYNNPSGLKKALDSLDTLASSIYVVDTGSSKEALASATATGLPLIQVEWRDSYSDLVNQALKAIDADFVIRMGADEYVLKVDHQQFRRATSATVPPTHGGWLWRQELNRERSVLYESLNRVLHPRFGDCYVGRVHERVVSGRSGGLYGKASGPFLGLLLGHDSEHYKSPNVHRYKSLIEADIKERPGDPYHRRLMLPYTAATDYSTYLTALKQELDEIFTQSDAELQKAWLPNLVMCHSLGHAHEQTFHEVDALSLISKLAYVAPAHEDTLLFAAKVLRMYGDVRNSLWLHLKLLEWFEDDLVIPRTHLTKSELMQWVDEQINELENEVEAIEDEDRQFVSTLEPGYADIFLWGLVAGVTSEYQKPCYNLFEDQMERRVTFANELKAMELYLPGAEDIGRILQPWPGDILESAGAFTLPRPPNS